MDFDFAFQVGNGVKKSAGQKVKRLSSSIASDHLRGYQLAFRIANHDRASRPKGGGQCTGHDERDAHPIANLHS